MNRIDEKVIQEIATDKFDAMVDDTVRQAQLYIAKLKR